MKTWKCGAGIYAGIVPERKNRSTTPSCGQEQDYAGIMPERKNTKKYDLPEREK